MSYSECSIRIINSVSDLLRIVDEIEQKFSNRGTGESLVWYRGHGNQKWELQPQVLRATFLDSANGKFLKLKDRYYQGLAVEIIINRIFRRESWVYLNGLSDTQIYYAAQHHGFPTRLLDWTTNPLVALFFACNDREQKGCLYQLMPLDLPNIYIGKTYSNSPFSDIVSGEHPIIAQVISQSLFDFELGEGIQKVQETPIIPLAPIASTKRIIAQSARFTFHPPILESGQTDVLRESSFAKKGLTQYIIPIESKQVIYDELNRLGIHNHSLFPDIDHLAVHIKSMYRIK